MAKKAKTKNLPIVYETTYILRPDITDDGKKTFFDKIKTIIQSHSGEVIASEDWGRRKLAYPIRKETRGLYVYLVYTGDNALVTELERNLRLSEHVMRFLSVKIQDDYDSTNFKYRPTSNTSHGPSGHAEKVERESSHV